MTDRPTDRQTDIDTYRAAIAAKKILLAKNDLHVMKRILYDTGPRVVARWSRREFSSGEKTPHPPKNGKNKFVIKCFLGHFKCFKQLFFLVEN